MLFKTAIALLIVWALGIGGVFAVGDLIHIFLLTGMMLLLLSFAKARDAALRGQNPRGSHDA